MGAAADALEEVGERLGGGLLAEVLKSVGAGIDAVAGAAKGAVNKTVEFGSKAVDNAKSMVASNPVSAPAATPPETPTVKPNVPAQTQNVAMSPEQASSPKDLGVSDKNVDAVESIKNLNLNLGTENASLSQEFGGQPVHNALAQTNQLGIG